MNPDIIRLVIAAAAERAESPPAKECIRLTSEPCIHHFIADTRGTARKDTTSNRAKAIHFLFADAMMDSCDPHFMSFLGQTPILFSSLPSLFLKTNIFENQHDRTVPGATISEEISAVRAYRGGLRATHEEGTSAPNLLEQYCSYQPCIPY